MGFGASAGTDWLEDDFSESSQNTAQNYPMENYFGTIPEGVDVLAPKNHLEDSRVTDAAPRLSVPLVSKELVAGAESD